MTSKAWIQHWAVRYVKRRCFMRWKSTLRTSIAHEHEQYIVKSPVPGIDVPTGVTVPEYLQATMGPWSHKIAFESTTGQRLTYSEVFRQSRSFGAALLQAGFLPGDVIGIVLQNIPEYASVQFGIWEAGLIASPVNPNYTPAEIERQLTISGAKGVVSTAEFIPGIRKAHALSPASRDRKPFIVCVGSSVGGCHSYADMIQVDPSSVTFPKVTEKSSLEDTVLLPFSSGTTGPPKGVCLTHYNLVANLLQVSAPIFATQPRLGSEQPRAMGVLPFFHAYGLMVFLSWALHQGAHTLCISKFESKEFLATVRRHRPTVLHLVPPLVALINNSDDYGRKELDSVESIMVGAAPVGRALIEGLMQKKGKEFYFMEGYGMTELSPVSHILIPKLGNQVIGSCGVPVPNTQTKVVDPETGKALGRNARGELVIKGPQVMKGYYNNEEATRNTIDVDGWLHTGDIAYYDDNGNCYIVDRIKELIKVKGFQVAPSELEDLLRAHEEVEDVAVIGVPHAQFGEAPRAYIVRKSECLTEQAVHSYLEPLISTYKNLKGGIEFVNSIPKAPSGKLLRRELLAEYKNKLI